MAACRSLPPAVPLDPTRAPQATLTLRTAARLVSPPPTAAGTVAAPQQRQEPSGTPRPSATPHFYTVQSGDTLETIAARFGVSAAALQAANGDLPPDMVIPGNVLLIPPPMSALATGTLSHSLPTNTPLPVPVSAPTCHRTPANEVICLGWVQNTLPDTLVNVAVQVELSGPTGENSRRGAALTQQIVPPQTGAPYAVRFANPPDFAHAEVQLLSAETVSAAALPAMPLTVIASRYEPDGVLVRVQGTIQYDGSGSLREWLVIAALFDAEDHVIGFRAQRQVGTLASGETWDVEVLVTPLTRGTVRHWLYAEGQPASPQE